MVHLYLILQAPHKKISAGVAPPFSGEISFELAKPPVPGKTPILSQFGAV